MQKIIFAFLILLTVSCKHNDMQTASCDNCSDVQQRNPTSETTDSSGTEIIELNSEPVQNTEVKAENDPYESLLKSKQVNSEALKKAIEYHKNNKDKQKLCPDYVGIADYTLPESKPRFFIANLKTGKIEDSLGISNSKAGSSNCGNSAGKVPCGFMKFGSIYNNKNYGLSMRITGLTPENSKSTGRGLLAIGSPPQPHTKDGKWVRAQYLKALSAGRNSQTFKKFVADYEKGEVSGIEGGKSVTKKFKSEINGQISFGGPTFDIDGMSKVQKLKGCMFMNHFAGVTSAPPAASAKIEAKGVKVELKVPAQETKTN